MKLLAFLLVLFASTARADTTASLRPHTGEPARAEENLRTVVVGMIDTVDVPFEPGVPRISNADVLGTAAPRAGHRLRFVPLRKGVSTVEIVDGQGEVRKKLVYNVITNELSAKVIELRQLLADARGLEVAAVNDRIVVDGRIANAREARRLAKLEKAYPELLDLADGAGDGTRPCAGGHRKPSVVSR